MVSIAMNGSGKIPPLCVQALSIVVDEPEQVFSTSRELDTHSIGGFCLAALRLSEANPNLKVIPLLKTHVYYPIFCSQ